MSDAASPVVDAPAASSSPAPSDEFVVGDFTGRKKRKPKKADDAAAATAPAAEATAAASGEAAASSSTAVTAAPTPAVPQEVGVLAAGETVDRDYNYTEMLERVFSLLREKNPNLAVRKRHVMPPPQLVRVGTRKTMWANFAQICQLMHRQPEHAQSFFLAEMGTEGSIDGSMRLVIKGRYQPKQVESLLKKYIVEYVTCLMCRNPETTLTRDSVTRLYFIQCESCGSRRSVAPIKTGFHATNRTDRRKVKAAV